MSLNKVMLIGHVGQDPEIRYVGQAGDTSNKVATFRLATTERYRDRNGEVKENTEWHSIVAWRSNADIIEKYVKKGQQLFIEGRLKTRSWQDQNGVTRYQTDVIADRLEMLGRPKESSSAAAAPRQQSPAQRPANPAAQQNQGYYSGTPQPGYAQQPAPQQPVVGPEDMPDDDLPF